MSIWYEGEVQSIENLSSTVKHLVVKVKTDDVFKYHSGQFVTMDLPIGQKRLERWRSYSIANACQEDNLLEFCIARLENGRASHYFFNELKKGAAIRFKGAEGHFYILPSGFQKDIVFICTGTGIAPFRAMIQGIFQKNIPHQSLHLIFGTRHNENLLYQKELNELSSIHTSFRYTPVLSREPSYEGFKGHVHQVYESLYQNHLNINFYICGWQNMVDETRQRLTAMGVPNQQIFYELYG
jgi:CDP-4-dehydro-6-deoxyglucose reductase